MTTATVTSQSTSPIPFPDVTPQKKLSRNRSFQQTSSSSQQQQQQRRHHVQHIGNYVIHKKTLGSGSMGTVKLAECLSDRDHQQYAVKIMPKVNLNSTAGGESTTRTTTTAEEEPKNKDPKDTPREREQRTIREMAIMRLLRHPNICQLKEYITEGDKYYMFLEFVSGGQLLDYIIAHGKLREKLARKFARQIVSALDYCHRNSIVHRDLKIENILITQNEEIKIIDFGLSNIYSPSRLLNTFCGSLYFAAPELLQARNYTGPEVDVWSFGVVLYVLVCGRVPFDDTSLPALHQKIKAGQVEYPDHLSKDCVDLLSKILVVDPLKRETLSFVIHHPWMNKGYDEPVFNYLPHRQPLKSIDLQVIQGMQGFGLGSPEEIETKLERIICSPEYQYAATRIDENYQYYQQQQKNNTNSNTTTSHHDNTSNNSLTTKFRRTISIRRTNSPNNTTNNRKDDPQSLPAMYDPLISIYMLVKERKEFDEKIRLLESGGYQSPVQLGRSASTSLTTRSSSFASNINQTDLRRRKTERVPPSHHTRNIFEDDTNATTMDWAAPNVNINTSSNATPKRSNSLRSGGTNLLQRSRSAAKRLGAMLPSSSTTKYQQQQQQQQQHEDTFNVIDNHHHRLHNSRDSLPQATTNNRSVSPELSYSSSLKKKTMSLLRSNSLTDRKYREAKKPVSSSSSSANTGATNGSDDEPLINRYGASAPSSTSNQSGGRFIEEGIASMRLQQQQQQQQQVPKMSAHPKSLFNFNRRHLFKMTTTDMMKNIQQVLLKLSIRYIPSPHEPYTLKCELSDWQRFTMAAHYASIADYSELDEGHVEDDVVSFTLMIYQARWAGGRLGVKVIEAEEKEDKMYRHIYHTILNELGTF